MRRDIKINTKFGDMVLEDRNPLPLYQFQWVSEDERFISGQLRVPGNINAEFALQHGVRTLIPYTPVFKPIKLSVIRDFGFGNTKPIHNPVTGGIWFEAYADIYGQEEPKPINASQLLVIGKGRYTLQLNRDKIHVFSGMLSDAVNVDANIQNRNLLLQCIPSNSYRYPVSGVGLVRYLYSDTGRNGLAEKLQKEFAGDGVPVLDASFNPANGHLELNLDFNGGGKAND